MQRLESKNAVVTDPTGLALGSLLVYVIGRTLPARERCTAWALVERWAAELIEAKHGAVGAR